MQIKEVYSWVDSKIPEKYKDKKDFDITGEELFELAQTFEVAIMHIRYEQPTKKELARGAKLIPNEFYIALDEPGKHYRQR